MRAIKILLGLVLAVSVGAFAAWRLSPEQEVSPPVATATAIRPEPAIPEKQERLVEEHPAFTEAKVIRQIAPETIAAPPASDVTLVREAPRPPLGELGLARDKPLYDQETPKGPMLRAPLAVSAGRLVVRGYRIRLAGVVPTPLDKVCLQADGSADPCGMRARTAFRQFLRGRAIRCAVPPRPSGEEIVTSCTLFKADLGAWLVEHGWALPDGDRYQAVATEARDGRLNPLAAPASNGQ